MIDETYAVFAAWDFGSSKKDNLDRLRRENFIGASTTTWLRDVAKVLNRRFDPVDRDRALVLLAKNGCPIEEWKPILLWHMTRDEFLLRDFLINWLFPTFVSGAYRVRTEDLYEHLRSVGRRGGTTEHAWSETTAEPRCRRFAQDGGRFWPAPRKRRQRICELPPAGAELSLSPLCNSGRAEQPAQSPRVGRLADVPHVAVGCRAGAPSTSSVSASSTTRSPAASYSSRCPVPMPASMRKGWWHERSRTSHQDKSRTRTRAG